MPRTVREARFRNTKIVIQWCQPDGIIRMFNVEDDTQILEMTFDDWVEIVQQSPYIRSRATAKVIN